MESDAMLSIAPGREHGGKTGITGHPGDVPADELRCCQMGSTLRLLSSWLACLGRYPQPSKGDDNRLWSSSWHPGCFDFDPGSGQQTSPISVWLDRQRNLRAWRKLFERFCLRERSSVALLFAQLCNAFRAPAPLKFRQSLLPVLVHLVMLELFDTPAGPGNHRPGHDPA